jgi:hypothetical protein
MFRKLDSKWGKESYALAPSSYSFFPLIPDDGSESTLTSCISNLHKTVDVAEHSPCIIYQLACDSERIMKFLEQQQAGLWIMNS